MSIVMATVFGPMICECAGKIIAKIAADSIMDKIKVKRDKERMENYLKEKIPAALETCQVDEYTKRLLKDEDKFSDNLIHCITACIFKSEEPRIEQFVTNPPCADEKLPTVRDNIRDIVSRIRVVLWNDDTFIKRLSSKTFQNTITLEIGQLLTKYESLSKEIGCINVRIEQIQAKQEDMDAKLNEQDEKINKLTVSKLVERFSDPSRLFRGRDDKIEELHDCLESRNIVFVTGFGGLGKSDLCREYIRRFRKTDGYKVVWITYTNSFRETIARGIGFTNIRDSDYGLNTDELFKAKQNAMGGEENILVVVDNYEPGEDFSDLKDLKACNCKAIITTRSSDLPNSYARVEIGPLSDEDSFQLLRETIKEKKRPWVDENRYTVSNLFSVIDNNTLMICILGELINKEDVDTDDLFQYLLKSKNDKVYSAKDDDDHYDTVMGHLRSLFRLSKIDGRALEILKAISLTPLGGIEKGAFLEYSKIDVQEIDNLVSTNWIQYSNGSDMVTILMHPLIRELITEDYPPSFVSFDGNISEMYAANLLASVDEQTDSDDLILHPDLLEQSQMIGDAIDRDVDMGRLSQNHINFVDILACASYRIYDDKKTKKYLEKSILLNERLLGPNDHHLIWSYEFMFDLAHPIRSTADVVFLDKAIAVAEKNGDTPNEMKLRLKKLDRWDYDPDTPESVWKVTEEIEQTYHKLENMDEKPILEDEFLEKYLPTDYCCDMDRDYFKKMRSLANLGMSVMIKADSNFKGIRLGRFCEFNLRNVRDTEVLFSIDKESHPEVASMEYHAPILKDYVTLSDLYSAIYQWLQFETAYLSYGLDRIRDVVDFLDWVCDYSKYADYKIDKLRGQVDWCTYYLNEELKYVKTALQKVVSNKEKYSVRDISMLCDLIIYTYSECEFPEEDIKSIEDIKNSLGLQEGMRPYHVKHMLRQSLIERRKCFARFT